MSSQLLADDTRYKIFQETLNRGEMTTAQYLEVLKISKSTLSHHLTKLVDGGMLVVRVASTGRPVKYWSVNRGMFVFKERLDGIGDEELPDYLQEQLDSQLTRISLLQSMLRDLTEQLEKMEGAEISFADTFKVVSEEPQKQLDYLPMKLTFVSDEEYQEFVTLVMQFYREVCDNKDEGESTPSHMIYFGAQSVQRRVRIKKSVVKREN
ncbi:MAG: winged helix-turn-helix domain-containing protein [Candidatus Kariarchaeaceae archaeon]|jgi:DNA-binding transcriptional ArsR family regulator